MSTTATNGVGGDSSLIPNVITFVAGASYGLNTVFVGQPFDTIKTRMQGVSTTINAPSGFTSQFLDLHGKEGVRGLYRGGLPLMMGGSLMRSAQFGVSAEAKGFLKRNNVPSFKILGTIDSEVLLSGIAGGLGRALVEIPTDFFKIRRQVQRDLKQRLNIGEIWRQSLDGSSVTMTRNTILFSSFIIYIDLSKQAVVAGSVPKFLCNDDESGLSPFAKGAICSNLAWITCFPLDVIKTQRQSGNYDGSGGYNLLKSNFQKGVLFRGVVPALIRSTIANGTSMVVYEFVHSKLSNTFSVTRKDMM